MERLLQWRERTKERKNEGVLNITVNEVNSETHSVYSPIECKHAEVHYSVFLNVVVVPRSLTPLLRHEISRAGFIPLTLCSCANMWDTCK